MEDPLPSTSKALDSTTEDVSENEQEPVKREKKLLNMSPGAVKLRSWLNKTLRIEMSDGRVLIGVFLCTDRDANIILGSCSEYLPEESGISEVDAASTNSARVEDEPRMLGLVMVPGKHIVTISIDQNELSAGDSSMQQPLTRQLSPEEIM